MLSLVWCLFLLHALSFICARGIVDNTKLVSHLQSELASCSNAQSCLSSFLRKSRVGIGKPPNRNENAPSHLSDISSRVAISTEENDIQCRIALSKAPIGSKCVAPCGCTGSQKWVQFSELNKLRRINPTQWTTCRTCQEKFNYSLFDAYGGPTAALIGLFAEKLWLLRASLLIMSVPALYASSVHLWLGRVLVSKSLWQKFPQWSRMVHLPLALKFWLLKIAVQWLGERWVQWERTVLLVKLADWEARLVEERLPIPPEARKFSQKRSD